MQMDKHDNAEWQTHDIAEGNLEEFRISRSSLDVLEKQIWPNLVGESYSTSLINLPEVVYIDFSSAYSWHLKYYLGEMCQCFGSIQGC